MLANILTTPKHRISKRITNTFIDIPGYLVLITEYFNAALEPS